MNSESPKKNNRRLTDYLRNDFDCINTFTFLAKRCSKVKDLTSISPLKVSLLNLSLSRILTGRSDKLQKIIKSDLTKSDLTLLQDYQINLTSTMTKRLLNLF